MPELMFKDMLSLKHITLPDNLTSIGKQAFMGCTNLSEITVPDNVTSIGDNAFSSCTGLTKIDLPDNMISIGVSAFYRCFGITDIDLPVGVTSINHTSFAYCKALKAVVIPGSVTSIGVSAFYGCTALASIVIPASVTSIASDALLACPNLTIYCYENSAAHNYAKSKSIKYKLINISADPIGPGCAIDYQKMFISGLPAGITNMDGYLNLAAGCTVSYTPNANGFGTDTLVEVIRNGATVENFKIVITGDINGNGNITALDALMVLQSSAGLETLDGAQQFAANVNSDASRNSLDALLILKYASGKITSFNFNGK